MKTKYYSLICLSFLLIFLPASACAQNSKVMVVEIIDTIDQSTVEILTESMREANNQNAQAIVLLLSTPGGGLQQTFDIAEMIQKSQIPVIGYVYPSGAYAWSAGTYILMSTHLAAMANHTIIGSCQPVEVGLEGTKIINDSKTINALVAWIQERATLYGRNTTLVKEFITINLNVNATYAKSHGAIEFVSSDIDQLLNDVDGTNVTTAAGAITLRTKDAEQIMYKPSFKIQFFKLISNPILTSLMLMLGIFALIIGISTPGYGAEVFGVIAILLSLIGSGFSIPILSIIFIIIGCLLLIVEIFVIPGFGVVGIGGIICLIVGSIFLVPSYPGWLISMDYTADAMTILLVLVILFAAFFAFLLYKVLQIRKKKTAIGTFIGEKAVAIDRITPDKQGYVRFRGEYWQAKSDTIIEPNTKVVVVAKDETVLMVKPSDERTKH